VMSTSACEPRKYSVTNAATLIFSINQRLQELSFLSRWTTSPPFQAAIISDRAALFEVSTSVQSRTYEIVSFANVTVGRQSNYCSGGPDQRCVGPPRSP